MTPTLLLLGARSDIARAMAHHFAEAGYRIQLAARQVDQLEADAQDLRLRYGVEVGVFAFDALDYTQHARFYESLSPKPTVVACVFGYLGEQSQAETDWVEAKNILEVNYLGAVSILEQAAQDLISKESGTIVGFSSVAGDRGRASNYFYGSAKAGFTAYLSGLRNRLHKSGVHVMTVKPGYVRTAMTEGMKLPGPLTAEPQQVANAVFRAIKKRKNVLYVKGIWRLIMWIIRHLPEAVFKRLSL